MSGKGYIKRDKEAIRKQLLEVAIRLFSERGIQNVTMTEIVKAVGISKPYFYKVYSSYGELIGEAIGKQRTFALEVLDNILADGDIPFEDEIYAFFSFVFCSTKPRIYIMEYRDQEHIYKHQNNHDYSEFQKEHAAYYETILHRLGIPGEKLNAAIFGNLYMSLINYSIAEEAGLVFNFSEEREATLNFASKMLAEHITGLREKSQ